MEMPFCAISNCTSSTNVRSQVNKDISFHRFPQVSNLKQKWIEATGRKDWIPTKYNTICSLHFSEDSFEEGRKLRILKRTACPTIDVMEIFPNEEVGELLCASLHSNVAGSLVEACIICLATDDDVTLYSLQYGQLKLYMDTILSINNDSHRGLPQFVCYECAVHLKKCYKLIKKCETSQAILVNILAQYGEVTKTLVRNLNRENLELKSSLKAHNTTPTYCYDYKYDYEENISCLTKIEYIYDGKTASDTKSNSCSIKRENYSIENEIEFDSESNKNEISIQTNYNYYKDGIKHLEGDYTVMQIEFDTYCDTIPIQTDDSNNDKKKLKVEHGISNKHDANSPKFIKDNVLCDEKETGVVKYEECSILNNNDDIDSTGLSEENSDENTENILEAGKTIVQSDNVKNNITISMCKKQSDKKEDKRSPLAKYFKIVKLTTLQEKIDEWRKSMENPSWAKRNPSNVYKCEVCWKLFANPDALEQHSIVHKSDFGNAECPVCKIRHKNENSIKKHMTYLHSKKYYCKSCPKSFTSRSVAAKHHLSHSGDVSTSVQLSALNNHIALEHSAEFPCELCGRTFSKREGLQMHRVKVHPVHTIPKKSNVFPCKECDFDFTTEEALRVHLLNSTQHKELKKSVSMKNTCRFCGRKFSSVSDFNEHLMTAHNKRESMWIEYPTVCQYCDEKIETRKDHYWHMRQQHPDEQYLHIISAVCELCGKGFRSTPQLNRHMLRHNSPKIPCPICGKKFHDKWPLEQHMETHRTERPHVCPTCGQSFKQKSTLRRHMKIHTDVTPYECSICGKQLKHKINLKIHIRTVHHKILCPSMLNRNSRRKEQRKLKRKNESKADATAAKDFGEGHTN